MHCIYLRLDDYVSRKRVIAERETGETRNSPSCRNRRINSAGYEFTLSPSSSFPSSVSLSLSFSLSSSRIKLLSVRLREPPRCNDPAHFRAPPSAIRISGTGDFFSPPNPRGSTRSNFHGALNVS